MSRNKVFSVNRLQKSFGGVQALKDVSLDIHEGEIHGLIGPNGAGKSTLVNVATGIYMADAGEIRFQGQEISRLPAYERSLRGITRTFQHPVLVPSLTVRENVMAGLYRTNKGGFAASIFRTPKARQEEKRMREKAEHALSLVGMDAAADRMRTGLTTGQERLIEVARAIVSEPAIMFLDEPAAGLTETEKEFLVRVLDVLSKQGHSFPLIEHNMDLVMNVVRVVETVRKKVIQAAIETGVARKIPHEFADYLELSFYAMAFGTSALGFTGFSAQSGTPGFR